MGCYISAGPCCCPLFGSKYAPHPCQNSDRDVRCLCVAPLCLFLATQGDDWLDNGAAGACDCGSGRGGGSFGRPLWCKPGFPSQAARSAGGAGATFTQGGPFDRAGEYKAALGHPKHKETGPTGEECRALWVKVWGQSVDFWAKTGMQRHRRLSSSPSAQHILLKQRHPAKRGATACS